MLFVCYPKCSTCKKAQKWLDESGAEYTLRDIKTDNPTAEELKGDDMLLQDFSKKTEELSPEDDSTPETVKEVYYMSEEAQKKSLELTELEAKGDLDAAEKIVDEMKQESKLIWAE